MLRDLTGHRGLSKKLKNLRWLKQTVEQWLMINCQYAKITEPKDALYWYNERPNVGALAGAAWKAKICAVEEYAAPKKKKKAVTSKRSGRVDLYLMDNKKHDAVVETKICWVSPGTTQETLCSKMEEACADARRDHDAGQKIGVVFYVIRVLKKDISEGILNDEVERIRNTKPDALAWCFPAAARELQSERSEYEDYVWPGVIMALKVAHGIR